MREAEAVGGEEREAGVGIERGLKEKRRRRRRKKNEND